MTKAKKAKPQTLLEVAASLPSRKRPRNWVDKIDSVEARREIRDFLVAKYEGRVSLSINEMARLICSKFGNVCNRQSIDGWIERYDLDRGVADVG